MVEQRKLGVRVSLAVLFLAPAAINCLGSEMSNYHGVNRGTHSFRVPSYRLTYNFTNKVNCWNSHQRDPIRVDVGLSRFTSQDKIWLALLWAHLNGSVEHSALCRNSRDNHDSILSNPS